MSFTPETAPPEQLIESFCELLSPARYVFSQNDAPTLYELIDNLPDDKEAIAEQLQNWCQQRCKVFNSLKSILSRRGVSDSIPARQPEDYKTMLKNKLRQNYPIQKQSDSQKPSDSSK